MRAIDWLLFAQVLASYSMRGSFDSTMLHVFLRFTECISRLLARQHESLEELRVLEESVVEFLALFELRYPKTELAIIFHAMLHLVNHIQFWGPLPSIWMFPYERFLGFLCRTIKNRTYGAATVTRFYLLYSHVQRQRHLIHSFMTNSAVSEDYLKLSMKGNRLEGGADAMQTRYGTPALTLLGQYTERTLDVTERRLLCDALRWLSPTYKSLCEEFEGARVDSISMDEWVPVRALSVAERQVIGGPSARVRVYPRVSVRGVEFRSASSEAKMHSRSSYFGFTSLDEKEVLRSEYGRILDIWEVFFDNKWQGFARVEIYKAIDPAPIGPELHGLSFELERVDTQSVDRRRRVLELGVIRSQVILAPPDERLRTSEADRLQGLCFVLNYASC